MEGSARETQLFNLRENPQELLREHHAPEVIAKTGNNPQAHERNLAEDPRFQQKRRELEALLVSEQQRFDDPYKLWDQQ